MTEATALWDTGSTPGEGVRAQARVLEYADGHMVAFAPHATVEVIEDLKVVEIPGSADYGLGLLAWREQWIPLLDLAAILNPALAMPVDRELPKQALVLTYRETPDAPMLYGAVGLPKRPRNTWVSDTDACPLPEDGELLPLFAIACFMHESRPVAILDAATLFAMSGEG